jgi:hypothetical protein
MNGFITIVDGLVQRFGAWVSGLFKRSEDAYKVLTDTEKKFANWSYGVIAIINANLDDLSPVVDLISQKYPALSHDQLQGFLDTIIKDIGFIVVDTPSTLPEAISAVAEYLSGHKGQVWQTISQTLGHMLAILFSPETPVQKFIQAAEYVYVAFVKPHVNS